MDASDALGLLPSTLRDELLVTFNSIVSNFRERRWEPSELNGGKLCEVVYSILKGYVDGSFPEKSSKPRNMIVACQQLENSNTRFPRSVRIQIPRMLVALYEVRNNRGVGHVGGEVNPNHMDATIVLYFAKWILSELVRIFHNINTEEATSIMEALTDRETPLIWLIDDRRKVLNSKYTMKEKVLLLLHSDVNKLSDTELVSWTEHTNISAFRRDVLRPLHKKLLIDYNESTRMVTLSPLGSQYVEQQILKRTI